MSTDLRVNEKARPDLILWANTTLWWSKTFSRQADTTGRRLV